MSIKKVKKGPFEVAVGSQEHIVLTSTIGNAQIGGNLIKMGGKVLAKGEIQNLNIGIGGDLIGKTLQVFTNVLDVNPATNRVSITHLFYNAKPLSFSYPQPGDDTGVDNDGDLYALTVEYKFTSL